MATPRLSSSLTGRGAGLGTVKALLKTVERLEAHSLEQAVTIGLSTIHHLKVVAVCQVTRQAAKEIARIS